MDEEVLKKLREYSSTPVVYRINEIGTERNYIGSTSNIYSRLYNTKFGYIHKIDNNLGGRIHDAIRRLGYDKFQLIIEMTGSLDEVRSSEPEYIIRYDSFNSGYNGSKNGRYGDDGMITITDGMVTKRVRPNELAHWESKGFYRGQSFRTNDSKIVVTRDGESFKFISEDEFSVYESLGYYRQGHSNSKKGTIFLYNPESDDLMNITRQDPELDKFLSKGYIKIRPWAPSRNRVMVTNGKDNKYIDPSELDDYLSKGFRKGKVYKNISVVKNDTKEIISIPRSELEAYQNLGYRTYTLVYVNNGIESRRVRDWEVNEFLSKGYVLGEGSKSLSSGVSKLRGKRLSSINK